jgi:hypothetical protein
MVYTQKFCNLITYYIDSQQFTLFETFSPTAHRPLDYNLVLPDC